MIGIIVALYLFVGLSMTIALYYTEAREMEAIRIPIHDTLCGLLIWPVMFLFMGYTVIKKQYKGYFRSK